MSLLVRINLALLVVFIFGASVAGWVSRSILRDNAKREVIDQARLMMESALAARSYTTKEIKPLLTEKLVTEFLPQSVPSYSATRNLAKLREKHPEYTYKEATLNPTNPIDRSTDWESDIIHYFRNNSGSKELIGERETQNGVALYLAFPLQITDPKCLECHSIPAAAPQTMRTKYGDSNGYGWNFQEVIGSQIVSVPLDAALKRADGTFKVFMISLLMVFMLLFASVNGLIYYIILRPITKIAAFADRVSAGDFTGPEFVARNNDEIGKLAHAFERMRRSLEKSFAMLMR